MSNQFIMALQITRNLNREYHRTLRFVREANTGPSTHSRQGGANRGCHLAPFLLCLPTAEWNLFSRAAEPLSPAPTPSMPGWWKSAPPGNSNCWTGSVARTAHPVARWGPYPNTVRTHTHTDCGWSCWVGGGSACFIGLTRASAGQVYRLWDWEWDIIACQWTWKWLTQSTNKGEAVRKLPPKN